MSTPDRYRDELDAPASPIPIPYGEGTDANGGCDECWSVPGRLCCLWNQPDIEPSDPNPMPHLTLFRSPRRSKR